MGTPGKDTMRRRTLTILRITLALVLGSGLASGSLSALTTWRDLGTAVGALVGGFLVVLSGPSLVYGTLAVIVSAVVLKVARSD